MTRKHAALALAFLAVTGQAVAQTPAIPIELPDAAPSTTGSLTASRIDQLVAPIALYPDPILTDILAAATYPAQVVEAARFAASNEGLQGAALADAAGGHNWDPSVQALLGFPAVLHMLDGDLEWTDQLGRAFMSQQGDVMDAIQRLRLEAERAGTLQNGPNAAVVNDGGAITINSPSPQEIYLPSYDASCAYGGNVGGCAGPADAIGWDAGVFLPYGFGQWGLLDWGRRCIRPLNHGGGVWHGGFSRPDAGTGRETSGAVWRHEGNIGVAGRIQAPAREHYSYAPPAGMTRPGYGAAPAMVAAHFAPAGVRQLGGMPGGAHMGHGAAAPAPIARGGMAPMGFGGHR